MKHLKLFFALFAMLALGVTYAWAEETTLTFDDKAKRTEYSTSKQVWVENGITFTNNKGSSTSNVGDYAKPARLYKSSQVIVACSLGNITQVVFDCNTNDYATALGNSISGSTVSEDKVTVTCDGSSNEFTISSLSGGQVRIDALTVTYTSSADGGETPDPTTYTIKWHTAKGVTTDVTLNEGAKITKPETDPTMTGYEFMGWTEDCAVASDGAGFAAITDFGTATEDKDYYAVFAKATTTGGGEAAEKTGEYTFSNYPAGAQYADNEEHKLDNDVTIYTTDCHFTTQLRIYSSTTYNGYVVSNKLPGAIKSMKFNAGNKVDVLVVYGSTDGDAWSEVGKVSVTSTSYKDYTLDFGSTNYTYFKLDVEGTQQVRIAKMSITYMSGGGTTTYSDYITTCASDIEYVELGDAFKWSATEAEVTIDATDNVFPTLTNTHNVPVKYSSSDETIATIADGTVTLKKEGSVTITAKYEGGMSAGTGKEYKAKTVTYSLKVNKAVAQPTGTMYAKVTDAVTDGEYLIVYEAGNVAFDGSLAALDVAGNMIEAQISSNTIAGNTEIDAATFTIASMEGGHSIQSKSGTYIGRTASGNGMNTGSSAILNIISITNGAVKVAGSGSGASASLQYFAQSGSERFRYYTSAQKAIALYKKVDPNAVVEPVFTPAAGEYYGTQSVTISCATAGAEVYYTLDGTDPTSASTKYTGAISIASTTTIKAVAIKGENSSAVVSATYTILAPLATMQAIFDKATDATQSVHIKFNDWVISGVVPGKDGKPSSNAYITDGSKGFIIYNKDGHGFNVGNKLSGTVVCDLTRYNGSAEVVGLTSSTEGLTVTTDGDVTPVEVADKSTLSGVNTGAVIKITGVCETKNVNSKDYFYVGGVQLYNSLFAYENPTVGSKYNVTGVYVQYNDVPEVLPRSAADIEEIIDLPTATISIANITMEVGETKTIEATITPDAAQSTVQYAITAGNEYITLNGTTITAVAAGTATITATIVEVAGEYYGATKTFNVTVKPQNIAVLPFTFTGGKTDIENTLGMSQDGLGTDYTTAGVTTNLKFDGTGDWVVIHFDSEPGQLSYEIKGNGFSGGKFTVQQSSDGSTYTDVFTYTELGDAATKEHELAAESRYVKFIYTEKVNGNVGLGNITISGALPTYTLTLVSNPDEIGATLTGAGTYKGTQDVTVTASNEDTEWVFAYWTAEEEIVSYDSEYTFRLGADTELVANFAMGGMESNMNDLVIDTDTYADTYMAVLTGSDASNGIEAMLAVSENIAGDLYRLAAAEVSFGGSSLDFVSGTVTIDMDAYTAIADVIVSFGGELMAIRMNMSATAAPVDVIVADATVTYNDNDGALRFNGTDASSSDAVYVELSGFEYNGVGSNTLSVAQISMFENSTAVAFADEVVVTIESDGTVSVEGTYTSWADGSVYNVSIWGALPTYTLTLVSNPDEIGATLTGAGTYYPTQEVTVTASNEDTEWVFAYWTVEEEVVSSDLEYTFRLGADTELVANFEQTTPAPTPDYTRTVEKDQWGTICLPFGATSYTGMELYEFVGCETGKAYIASVTTLEAGVPYIFLATAAELAVYSDGTTAPAGSHNGLHGTFTDDTEVAAGNYILKGNKLCQCATTCYVNANRAYVVWSELPTGAPQQMPGRKYISMDVQGENETTGIEDLFTTDAPAKVIVNGQLIIIRDGVKYNVQGQVIK